TASNTFYLSGYESTNCRILITNDKDYFFTDMRYLEEAKNAIGDRFEVLLGGVEEIKGIVDDLGVKALGVEENVSYGEYRSLEELFKGVEFVAVDEAFSKIRAIKTEREISLIKTAQSVTETAFNEILPFIKEGVTEIEIAARLEYIMLKNGCELAFDSIVAFGENGSKPHAHRSERKLRRGEFVTMDFGAKYKGYCSDMTRTVALGAVDERKARAYNAVLEANKLAEKAIKIGEKCCDIDAVARNYLAKFSLDKFFSHSLGHSVGVDIHEMPAFSPRCDEVLKEGMIITVEPGVYLEGDFGLRIEDMALVTKNGAEILTHADKNLIVL
ncbi:MAG TPA: aminopeptidase P family protein, partial [Candidatus Ornithoclostridium faecavium]|nr:aminopeptidase P family protein [Candidatus Ornithoclostridium faecavium]